MNIEVDFSEKIVASGRASLITKLIYLQNQFKIFHWQTFSYAQHEAFGHLYSQLSEKIDEFVETYQGIYERLDFSGETIAFSNLRETNFAMVLSEQATVLKSYDEVFAGHSDLLNIRDEMLAVLNKTSYLLSLV